jgi:pyrimidine operon attenuation protein/uracil phosphoribosyltransferase
MSGAGTCVLDHEGVARKIERIAHQLHEHHFEDAGLTLVGVVDRGAALARQLSERLAAISELDVHLAEIRLDKDEPHASAVQLSVPLDTLAGRSVVLVDDVLMSGRTLMHAAAYLVQVPLKRLSTVVLVDRRHRTFPIRADIVGLTLSTNLEEHISVVFGRKTGIYLG